MASRSTFTFRLGGLDPLCALEVTARVLAGNGFALSGLTNYGKLTDFSKLINTLKKTQEQMFSISVSGFNIHLNTLASYQIANFSVESQMYNNLWDIWALELINENFVSGRLVNTEFEYWQNAKDRLEYISHGRSWDHLPKKSNGLPSPLEQTIVDISQNPGRRILHVGFVEAIGSIMWLGQHFWKATGAKKEEVLSSPLFKCSKFAPGVLRVEADSECFSTDGGDIGKKQRRMREIFFPRAK